MLRLTKIASQFLPRRRLKGILLAAGILGLITGIISSHVRAYTLDVSKIQSIPHYDVELSAEAFMAQSKLMEEDPEKDPTMSFSMRVPLDWQKAEDQEEAEDAEPEEEDQDLTHGQKPLEFDKKKDQRVLGKVARYLGPPRMDYNSWVEVKSLRLEHDISAKNWFLNFILTQGYSLQGMRAISDYRLEALYNMVEQGVPYVVRTLAEMNGPRMVIVTYYLPEKYWMQERAQQEHVVNSFTFKNPEKIRIEKTLTYKFLDLLRFEYPISWRLLAPNIYSIEGMEARLLNTEDDLTLSGEIKLNFISTELDTTLSEEIGYLKQDLEKVGIKIGNLIESPTEYVFYDHIFFSRVEVYETEAAKGLHEHEYWLAIMVEDRYYYIITMLTPSRDADFLTWARNIEAFETVIESIRP